jgi:hypothetical protein
MVCSAVATDSIRVLPAGLYDLLALILQRLFYFLERARRVIDCLTDHLDVSLASRLADVATILGRPRLARIRGLNGKDGADFYGWQRRICHTQNVQGPAGSSGVFRRVAGTAKESGGEHKPQGCEANESIHREILQRVCRGLGGTAGCGNHTQRMGDRANKNFSSASIVVSLKSIEGQKQILRLTTPKLKYVLGPVRSG